MLYSFNPYKFIYGTIDVQFLPDGQGVVVQQPQTLLQQILRAVILHLFLDGPGNVFVAIGQFRGGADREGTQHHLVAQARHQQMVQRQNRFVANAGCSGHIRAAVVGGVVDIANGVDIAYGVAVIPP